MLTPGIFNIFPRLLLLAVALFGLPPSAAATPQSGWWWNPAEGGRGFNIEVQGGTMFMSGYMYDNSGNAVWYVSGPMAMINDSSYQGVWQQFGNGQTLNGTYQPASVVNSNVGMAIINFQDAQNATMVLPPGQPFPLKRFSFGSAGPLGTPMPLSIPVQISWRNCGSGCVNSFDLQLGVFDTQGHQIDDVPIFPVTSGTANVVDGRQVNLATLTTEHLTFMYERGVAASYLVVVPKNTGCQTVSGGSGTITDPANPTNSKSWSNRYPTLVITC